VEHGPFSDCRLSIAERRLAEPKIEIRKSKLVFAKWQPRLLRVSNFQFRVSPIGNQQSKIGNGSNQSTPETVTHVAAASSRHLLSNAAATRRLRYITDQLLAYERWRVSG
jgi:hypothetical protein